MKELVSFTLGVEVVYEGIGALCSVCGRVGHKRDGCPYVIQSPEKPIEIQQ